MRVSLVGVAVAAAVFALSYANGGFASTTRAYAGIALPNPASIALHERFGFKKVAHFTEQGRKFDRFWDVAWFEKVL